MLEEVKQQIEKLMESNERLLAQHKKVMEVLHARSEMTKIAIAALQHVAIDPTGPRVAEKAKVAIDRMKEIWLTCEQMTGGTLDAKASNNPVKF